MDDERKDVNSGPWDVVADAGFLCLKPLQQGDAQGGADDGEAGEAGQKGLSKSQDGSLRSSGSENKADDQGGQKKGARIEPTLEAILI